MRILALVAVVWSFVGMPMLCRAGVLVECCAPAAPMHTESRGRPAECPDKCPDRDPDKCPDGTGSPEQRNCSACAEACNAMAPHPKQMVDDDFAVMSVVAIAATQVPCGEHLPPPYGARDDIIKWSCENIPFPVSDRPLRI